MEETWYTRLSDMFKRVKSADLMIFTRQLSTLLSAGVSLSDSLLNLYRQTTNPMLKEITADILNDIDAGFSLSQALDRHKSVFSGFYINMVRSAEVTGRMNEVLGFLADYLEKQSALTSKVKNALTYPAFVVVMFFVVLMVLVTVVLPQITPIFTEAKVELPLYTRMVIGFGDLITNWWWAIGIGFLGLAAMLVNYFKTPEGKVLYDEIILRLPILGKLFRKLYVARFAESTRMLIKGGLTIPQSIEISAHTIGNSVYRDLIHQAADRIRKGEFLSRAIADMPEFPPLVSQLISVGESTGKLDELLLKINQFYTRQVEDMVDNLVTLIQPIMMLVIGVMVAFLFAAILLPLYSLSNVF